MSKIRLLSWNVNGIRAVDRKKGFDWFFKDKPDVLCLQETKALPEQVPAAMQEVEGYHVSFASAKRKGYSGVAVYSRPEPANVTAGLGVKKFDVEGRTLVIDYDDFLLYNIYYPNGGASEERLRYKMAFYAAFLKEVVKQKKKGRNLVICGDVNTAHTEIDLARPKGNEKNSGFLPEERAWMDKFLKRGFVDTFRMFNQDPGQYSWWDYKTRARERDVGWRIDYFFVNEEFKDNVKDAFILKDIMGSDHCPVGIQIEI
jgi:exodeoxyribonuclease-3